MGALFAIVCFCLQAVSILSITYIKVKYFLDERKRKRLYSKNAVHPIGHIDKDLSPGLDIGKREKRLDTNMRNEIEIRANIRQHHASWNEQIVPINNYPYNKILIEVFQMAFVMTSIAITLTVVAVKKNLNDGERVHQYSQAFLCFLDLAPRILLSIILPLAIHIRNPEIQKYIKGIFRS